MEYTREQIMMIKFRGNLIGAFLLFAFTSIMTTVIA
jgi:hypothetical protein